MDTDCPKHRLHMLPLYHITNQAAVCLVDIPVIDQVGYAVSYVRLCYLI
jgi:hypothetical protein